MIFLIDTNWNEHYIKRGDPSKLTYYIIRRKPPTNGLFARYNFFVCQIRYALSNGWLPVIDMQNYPNIYLPSEKLGKENSWEYYFEQPLRIGLEQAYSGENIILSHGELNPPNLLQPNWDMDFYENKNGILTEWRMLIKLGLLKIKPALMKEIDEVRKKLFMPGDKVLGVLLRGTDYLTERPYGHPIPPPMEFALSTIIAALQDWKCNKIFLATEDKNILKTVKNVFENLCLTYDREYIDYVPGRRLGCYGLDRANDHFLQGKDYLIQMVLLSMCNSFIAARCSGATGVMLMADKFEHTYFFNLGKYNMISFE